MIYQQKYQLSRFFYYFIYIIYLHLAKQPIRWKGHKKGLIDTNLDIFADPDIFVRTLLSVTPTSKMHVCN